MAAEQHLSGAESIRSLTDQDAIFRAFDSYPWTKDTAFMRQLTISNLQSGLHAILGDPNSPNQQGSPADMATHARIFYYTQRIGVNIDFTSYQSWLTSNRDSHVPPNILPPEYLRNGRDNAAATVSQATSVLDWQKAAPKTDLYVDRSAAAAAGEQPAYPMAFAEMIKLLQEGREVPGIRQIPNTIVRDPTVKPVGARSAPRKPWEKAALAPSVDTYRIAALDSEFPPVETNSDLPEPETA
ncbi:hypothetical protein NQ176_g6908 [Zarea fungicola]|uniref:Uncharacterized protein n=1 Tax=Zarea fungicola TaxID=93591 RepID=A0ACC1N274_9HYPO|nr:hypothetical protein NQ176_g6908 [Lecanicillium fungicola]